VSAGALEYQYPPHMRQGSYAEEGRAVNTLKVSVEYCRPASHCHSQLP